MQTILRKPYWSVIYRSILSVTVLISLNVFGETAIPAKVTDLMDRITEVNLTVPEKDQEAPYEKLLAEAETYFNANQNAAEAWVVVALARASYARTQGMGALGDLKQVRKELEHAMELNPKVMNGYPYSFLGRLYFMLPAWPISFGSDKKGRKHIEESLAIDDTSMENQYSYGLFWLAEKKYDQAKTHLEAAKTATPLFNGKNWVANMQKQIDDGLAEIAAKSK